MSVDKLMSFLEALGPAARTQLLRVLESPSGVRVPLIGQLNNTPQGAPLAELLIELEMSEPWRLSVLAELRRWEGP